jgi:hypothetical protein
MANTYTTKFNPAGTTCLRVHQNSVADEAVPTDETHGMRVSSHTNVGALVQIGDAAALTLTPYVAMLDSNGRLIGGWTQMTDGDGVLKVWTTLANSATLQFNVKDYDLFDLVVTATGGGLTTGVDKSMTASGPLV